MSRIKKQIFTILLFTILNSFTANAHAIIVLTICDSITQGLQRTASGVIFGRTVPGNGAANVGGYQPRLNQLLNANVGPSVVYNWGTGGERTFETVGRINAVLNSRPADYILILCGANDVFWGISSNTVKANIAFMIDQSRNKNVIPIISDLTPFTAGGRNTAVRLDYNPKILALGQEKTVTAVSQYAALDAGWYSVPYHSGDELHLSNAGYARMADTWFDALTNTPTTGGGNGYLESVMQIIFLEE